MKKNNYYPTVILGGGIAGLTVAWRLLEKGISIVLLERENNVGGLSRTVSYKNFLFDFSAHRFNSNNPEVVRRFKKLIGIHCVRRNKITYIRHWGKYISYPPKAMEVIKTMPLLILIPAFFDFVWTHAENLFRQKKTRSFSDWTRSRFGRTLSYHLNEQYADKVWKTPSSKLSSDWASVRIGNFKILNFFIALLFPKFYSHVFTKSDPDINWFYYSDIGIGYLSEQMKKEIVRLGGIVKTKSIVTRIQNKKDKYVVSYLENGLLKNIETEKLISSIPINILCQSIFPKPPQEIIRTAQKLAYLSVLVVNIIIKKESVSNAHWIYYPEKEIIFNYIVEFKNWSKKMVKKGMTSLSVNITCKLGDSFWEMSDKQLINRVVADLEKVKMITKSDVIDGFVSKLPYAYPIYSLDYKENITFVKKYFQSLPNFYLTGRTGSFDYSNADQVMEKSLQLADEII